MVRLYAKVVGVTVILIGVVGLLLGDKSLLGVLNFDLAEDGIHLLTGGLLAYAGFAAKDLKVVRAIVGGIGVAYLVSRSALLGERLAPHVGRLLI